MGIDMRERENSGDLWTGDGSERGCKTRVSQSCRGTVRDGMVAQNEPWMDIEWTWRGMTGSGVSWIPIVQGYCSGVRTRLGYSSGAREQIKDTKKY